MTFHKAIEKVKIVGDTNSWGLVKTVHEFMWNSPHRRDWKVEITSFGPTGGEATLIRQYEVETPSGE